MNILELKTDTMKYRRLYLLKLTILFFLIIPFSAASQSRESDKSDLSNSKLVLVKALLCEDIQERLPLNSTTVFSIERRKAFCYTSFDPVPRQTVIYHHWFHRDIPSAKNRLVLKPPRWSSYSSIQLRETDKGPWRVEITDEKGRLLGLLRFSITD